MLHYYSMGIENVDTLGNVLESIILFQNILKRFEMQKNVEIWTCFKTLISNFHFLQRLCENDVLEQRTFRIDVFDIENVVLVIDAFSRLAVFFVSLFFFVFFSFAQTKCGFFDDNVIKLCWMACYGPNVKHKMSTSGRRNWSKQLLVHVGFIYESKSMSEDKW